MGFLPLWHVFLLILNLRVERLLNLRRMLGWHTMAIPLPMDTADTMAILTDTTMDMADSEEERGLLNIIINNKTEEAFLVDLEGVRVRPMEDERGLLNIIINKIAEAFMVDLEGVRVRPMGPIGVKSDTSG